MAVNLAVALARGKKVGLVDADIYGFSVPDMMGIDERPGIDGKEIIPVETWVKVISMAFCRRKCTGYLERSMLGKMLTNFFTEVQWENLIIYFLIYHLAREM